MGKILAITLTVCLVLALCVGCGKVTIDYEDVALFEEDLNKGEDLKGKTVTITVDKLVPDSAFGYNIQTGEHLNFCSGTNPNVETGDMLNVKVTEVISMLGSYIISYELVK